MRHVYYEDLGGFEELLRARGYTIRYVEAGLGSVPSFDPEKADLLVVLGGPVHAYDVDKYPFLKKEISLLEARLSKARPTIGIGLGAELMARALGARVYLGPRVEIGWAPLTLTDAGRASPLHHLIGPVLHWHSDVADLPDGATRLAFSEVCPNAAYSYGRNATAWQFHLETLAKRFERWLINRAPELAAAPSVSITRLRADTARFARSASAQGQRCLAEWLDQITL